MTDISFIIPTHNAESTLPRVTSSLDELHARHPNIEAIFVDDASTDGSPELLNKLAAERSWMHVVLLETNNGGPSEPRNVGVQKATGTYVFFLDSDDEVLTKGVLASLDTAVTRDAQVVRAPLISLSDAGSTMLNVIPGWTEEASKNPKTTAIFSKQSTTVCGLISRDLLIDNAIRWDKRLRMGEDTVFLAEVLKAADRISYQGEPDFIYHKESVPGKKSSTQQYEERELRNHLEVWTRVSAELATIGVSYMKIRGQVALQTSFLSMCRHNRGGFSEEIFLELVNFARAHRDHWVRFTFEERIEGIRKAILNGDYSDFLNQIRTRMVIAGMDLKFIDAAIPELGKKFNVRIDQWSGHDAHDEKASKELLRWADVIFCEWLLGNAVWYSHNKAPSQRLIARCHLFEIKRDFGFKLNVDNVDKIIAVSLPTLEDMQARFAFPREKVALVPNFIDTEAYATSDDPNKVFNLAIVGILPARKGFHRALQLLELLHKKDSRYNLTVYGKLPEDLPWVANDPQEKQYFDKCREFIFQRGLGDALSWPGWSDMKISLADKGFVLSVSDFESFHVAPAEAFASENMALFLPWDGVRFIYPGEYVCGSVQEMADRIYSLQDLDSFRRAAEKGTALVRTRYSRERFVDNVTAIARGDR